MRILFLASAHNSLSQRLFVELTGRGHEVRVHVVTESSEMTEVVARETPELIIAPMLEIAIPPDVYMQTRCLIVHPGIKGDRGPSSLDWAILNEERAWGVTIIEAAEEFDAGPIWASPEFALDANPPRKSSLYRGLVTEAALRGVLDAIARLETGEHESGSWRPEPLCEAQKYARGRLRPPMKQADRAINWERDTTASIIRKVRAADSAPGVLCTLLGVDCFLYGAHEEERLKGPPGQILARRDGAICIGAVDGAVWISHLKAKSDGKTPRSVCHVARMGLGCRHCVEEFCALAGIKLPAEQVLGPLLHGTPEEPLRIDAPADYRTFREILYQEEEAVGYLSFDFYNGAMSTSQCQRLRDAFLYARSRPTKVIAFLGGRDFWSNGIHLNVIEASQDPAMESWRNINAMNDLVHEVINTSSHIVIAGLRGNAGAGGAILALAADHVFARPGVVLNPHYRGMGNLYGSEYWTYLLPRRVGQAKAQELTELCQPLGAQSARKIGLLDDVFGKDVDAFEKELRLRAAAFARDPAHVSTLVEKLRRRLADNATKPLTDYRAEELARMHVNFFGPDPAYHEARRRFVFKGSPPDRVASSSASVISSEAEPTFRAPMRIANSGSVELSRRGIAEASVQLMQGAVKQLFARVNAALAK